MMSRRLVRPRQFAGATCPYVGCTGQVVKIRDIYGTDYQCAHCGRFAVPAADGRGYHVARIVSY